MKLFDFVSNCFTKEEKVTSSKYQFDNYYIITRFLSMNKSSFVTSVYVNNVANKLPKWMVGCLLYWVTPKMYTPRINYIKKDKLVKKEEELIQRAMDKFCCSRTHALQCVNILKKEGVNLTYFLGGTVK
jgi:hypothetical protein